MTGTALTEEKEFRDIYGMDVVEIPTNLPVLRKDLDDAVYKTKDEKFKAVIEEIVRAHETGQPVLVGTITIETSELLSNMLKKRGIQHNVLNAKFHEMEAEITALNFSSFVLYTASSKSLRRTGRFVGISTTSIP